MASGDIKYNDVPLNAKSGGTVEKFCKTKKTIGSGLLLRAYNVLRHPIDNYKNHKFGKIKDGPIPIESTPVSGFIEAEPEVKFWDREKKMVQNAFICSQVRRFVKPKGSLISESFSTLAQTSKKSATSQIQRIWHLFGYLSQNEKLFEIKPPLESRLLTKLKGFPY